MAQDDPLAGIITQVTKDGNTASPMPPTQPGQSQNRSFFRKLFCGCFPTRAGLEDSNGSMAAQEAQAMAAKMRENAGLPALLPEKTISQKLTLILDLDETLVHSSFQPVPNPDFVIPVEVDGAVHRVFVCKRPGVDDFMKRVGELYEVVVFTASLDKYANPVLDLLDKNNSVHFRLFREACVMANGSLVKDLTKLGRDLNKIIIVDNSPTSYMLQPQNAVPISSWFDDMTDNQLHVLLPWFEEVHAQDDIYPYLSQLRTRMHSAGTGTDMYHQPPSFIPQQQNPYSATINSITSPPQGSSGMRNNPQGLNASHHQQMTPHPTPPTPPIPGSLAPQPPNSGGLHHPPMPPPPMGLRL